MNVEKDNVGGIPFLSKKLIQEKGIKIVKIKSEAVPVETEFEGKKSTKLECNCSTQIEDPKEVKWQMNPTTKNYMIDTYGSDTKLWIGKTVDIAVKQAGSANPGVYPKNCSLEKIIA